MDNEQILNISSAYIEGGEMFFSAWNINGFFSCDLESGEARLLAILPYFSGRYGYGTSCSVDDSVYLSPCGASSIVELKKGIWQISREYQLERAEVGSDVARYGNIIPHKRKLYFCPYHAHSIMEFDIDSHQIVYWSDCYKLTGNNGGTGEPLFGGGIFYNNMIWMISYKINIVICFDPESKYTKAYKIGQQGDFFADICRSGEFFYIYCKSGKVLKWNEKNGSVSAIKNIWEELGGDTEDYVTVCAYKDRIWIANAGMRKCISIDGQNDIVKLHSIVGIENDIDKVGKYMVLNNDLYYLPEHNNYLYRINFIDDSVHAICVALRGENLKHYNTEYMKECRRNGIAVQETENRPFSLFAESII